MVCAAEGVVLPKRHISGCILKTVTVTEEVCTQMQIAAFPLDSKSRNVF